MLAGSRLESLQFLIARWRLVGDAKGQMRDGHESQKRVRQLESRRLESLAPPSKSLSGWCAAQKLQAVCVSTPSNTRISATSSKKLEFVSPTRENLESAIDNTWLRSHSYHSTDPLLDTIYTGTPGIRYRS